MPSSEETENEIYEELNHRINHLVFEFKDISLDRKLVLAELTSFMQEKIDNNQKILLNFICTHNSRRSHMAQLWAQVAAFYYDLPGVECFSGGTEATAFNSKAVEAMKEAGFNIAISKEGRNPLYKASYAEKGPSVIAFSKKYDNPFNPNKDFAAIMTCSHADQNCPLVNGASVRIALTYDDPKEFDGTELESTKYRECVNQIGRELLYAFAQIRIE